MTHTPQHDRQAPTPPAEHQPPPPLPPGARIAEVTPERRARFGLSLTLRLAVLFPNIREQIRTREDLLLAAAHVLETVDLYFDRWRRHPDFDRPWSSFGIPYDPLAPAAVAVYTHPPAREGKTHSFVIAGISDLVSDREHIYGKRRLGELSRIVPVSPDFIVHPTRVGIIDNSYSAGGAGYVARMKLKEYLPRDLWPWIQRVRGAARDGKNRFLAPFMRENFPNGEENLHLLLKSKSPIIPPSYWRTKKRDLWYEEFKRERGPELERLEGFIDFKDMWKVATNKVAPEDLPNLLKQRQLFQIERRNRSGLDRPPRPRQLVAVIADVLARQDELFKDPPPEGPEGIAEPTSPGPPAAEPEDLAPARAEETPPLFLHLAPDGAHTPPAARREPSR